MKRIVFILTIISSVICSCNSKAANQQKNQKNTKEITEQNIAVLAARCVNALQNKENYWDEFHFCETIDKLCKEFGMSSHVIPQSEFEEAFGVKPDFFEGMEHEITGKDSLLINISSSAFSTDSEKGAFVRIFIGNPIQYGAIVPKRYRDAILEEFRKQGWYSEGWKEWKFNSNNIRLREQEYPIGYVLQIEI